MTAFLAGVDDIGAATVIVSCPSRIELSRYVEGALDEAGSRALEDHFDACPPCVEAMHDFDRRFQERHRPLLSPCPRGGQPDDTEERREIEKIVRNTRPSARALRSATLSAGSRRVDLTDVKEIDDFQLLRELGKGAFATVYLAWQKSMRRLVALKVTTRQTQEAPVLSRLDHPHIVRVHDERPLADRGIRLLYLKYAPGGSLKDVVDRIGMLPPERRVSRVLDDVVAENAEESRRAGLIPARGELPDTSDWATTVCRLGAPLADALGFAHKRDILHRDLKPANVLLTADGLPMLADFNLSHESRAVGSDSMESDAAANFGGSLPYMSPEQLEVFLGRRDARELDPRDDLFSLGVLLWELLTGERPFETGAASAGNAGQLSGLIADRRRGPPLDALPASCPAGLREVLEDCLAADRGRRSADAGEIARRLQIAAMPDVERLTSPPPNTWPARAARWPVAALILCGMIPNGVLAVINVAYNRYGFSYGDAGIEPHEFAVLHWPTHETAMSVVNPIVFPLAIGLCYWLILPLLRAVRRRGRGAGVGDEAATRPAPASDARALEVGFNIGSLFARVILALWTITGVVYPLWNALAVPGKEHLAHPESAFLCLFATQTLFGVLGASLTFLLANAVAARAFLPLLSEGAPFQELRTRLDRQDVRVDWHRTLLGLTPPAALLTVALAAQTQTSLMMILAGVGAVGFGVAQWIVPRIHQTLGLLRLARLSTTHDLIYGRHEARTRP